MVTVRYCQLNYSHRLSPILVLGWSRGVACGDRYFLANLWSSFENGRFLGSNANYFFGSINNSDFSIKVDWVRSSLLISVEWELPFFMLLYISLFTGRCIGFATPSIIFSPCAIVSIVWELSLFLCNTWLVTVAVVLTSLTSLEEDLLES